MSLSDVLTDVWVSIFYPQSQPLFVSTKTELSREAGTPGTTEVLGREQFVSGAVAERALEFKHHQTIVIAIDTLTATALLIALRLSVRDNQALQR